MHMNLSATFSSFKVVGYVVLLAMAAVIIYAAYIALTHWSGIGV
jgi:hypothetical protein